MNHPSFARFRFTFLFYLSLLFLFFNFLFRLSLPFFFPENLPFSGNFFLGLGIGAINDIFALFFILILPFFCIFLPKDSFFSSTLGKIYSFILVFIFSLIFIFTSFSEYFFWEEFSSRFNFIAVDYLVYTTEVIQNIIESYPLAGLLSSVFVLSVLVSYFVWKKLQKKLSVIEIQNKTSFWKRFAHICCYCLVVTASYFVFSPLSLSSNRYWIEFADNGVYQLFSAFIHNELDYRKFYKTMDTEKAFALLNTDLNVQAPLAHTNYRQVINSSINIDTQEKNTVQSSLQKPNVVLVIIESLGSYKYQEQMITLNNLAKESLYFPNMKSTGTRTVRGIEAIMLSIPPTPGNSIVRRDDNDNLYNLSTPLKKQGYDLSFIYGGIGFFDNMNAFFSGIGFNIHDKLEFDSNNKTFSNAWGQCDGDAYKESIRLADKSFANNTPFMQVILTTSNHRPFTFPENTINLPQGSREAAVRYTDYAIGEFLKEAKTKKWFDNTIFVFIADHPSSVAGKNSVPHEAYGIMSMIYAPKLVKPQQIDLLCNQIDLAPTLLALMGVDYTSPFFGKNILTMKKEEERAFISTYQLLGLETPSYLTILSPNSGVESIQLDKNATEEQKQKDIEKTIAYYQTAYDLFSQNLLKEDKVTITK